MVKYWSGLGKNRQGIGKKRWGRGVPFKLHYGRSSSKKRVTSPSEGGTREGKDRFGRP